MNPNFYKTLKSTCSCLTFAGMVALAMTASQAQRPTATPAVAYPTLPLLPGQQVERDMSGGETHRYSFELKKEEFFQVRVEQNGVDVVLKLVDTSGNVLCEMDSPNGTTGPEILSFAASKSQKLFLTVASLNAGSPKGPYVLSRTPSRAAMPADKHRVEIEKIFMEGVKAANTVGQADLGIAKLERALAGWTELHDPYLVDLTSNNLTTLRENRFNAVFAGFFNELQKATDLNKDGSKLVYASKADQLAGRQKLNEAIDLYRGLSTKLDDPDFTNKIKNESSPKPRETLTSLRYFAKGGETTCLGALSDSYWYLGEWEQAYEYKKLAQAGYQEVVENEEFAKVIEQSSKGQLAILKKLSAYKLKEVGDILIDYLGRRDEGLSYLNRSLQYLERIFSDTQDESVKSYQIAILMKFGNVYGHESQTAAKSIEYYENALKICRELTGRESDEATLLTVIGAGYMTSFQYSEARRKLEEALAIFHDKGNKFGESQTLQLLAAIAFSVGNKDELRKLVARNLVILQSEEYAESYKRNFEGKTGSLERFNVYREMNDDFIEYARLGAIARSYSWMDDYPRALEYSQQTLAAARKSKDPAFICQSLFDVGDTLGKLSRWNESLPYFVEQLQISREARSRQDIANALRDMGWGLLEAGKFAEAVKYQDEALSVFRSIGVDEDHAFTPVFSRLLNDIGRTYRALGNKRLAILYGKRAVNAMQGERQRLNGLDPITQKGFLEKEEKHYRRLAEWLVESGRVIEAEQVLAMLKQEEVADYLRTDRTLVEKTKLRIEFTPKEKEALQDYQRNTAALSTIGAEFSKLDNLKRKGVKLTADQQKQYDDLDKKLIDANQQFQDFLDRFGADLKKGSDAGLDPTTENKLQGGLKAWGDGLVLISTAIGDNLVAILRTADPNVSKTSTGRISAADLNKKIFEFREAVKNPAVDPRPLGKELYDVLVKPFEVDLEASKTKSILWSLDGNLRLVPMAALWDGKQYLAEKYQNVMITEAGLMDIGATPSTRLNVLALGVSDAKSLPETLTERRFDFNALPSVPFEIDSIARTRTSPRGVLPGAHFLNASFTREAFADQLRNGYKVVHIASHFSMNAGDASRSFLLLGDGTGLKVSDLDIDPRFKQRFQGVELLTLSACDTAVAEKDSSGKEVDGFAYVAQQNGAQAILASLWSVADTSTGSMMAEFYRSWQTNRSIGKAEALRRAQLGLLNGKHKPGEKPAWRGAELAGISNGSVNAPPFRKDDKAPFAHPYYWAPFILIGNWR